MLKFQIFEFSKKNSSKTPENFYFERIRMVRMVRNGSNGSVPRRSNLSTLVRAGRVRLPLHAARPEGVGKLRRIGVPAFLKYSATIC